MDAKIRAAFDAAIKELSPLTLTPDEMEHVFLAIATAAAQAAERAERRT